MSWGVLVWFIDDMELLNICATLGTDSINCTQNAACALLATETAGAVSMIDHIDELEEKGNPEGNKQNGDSSKKYFNPNLNP